jgi:hypothetical protein
MDRPRITRHAVDRYIDRVNSSASPDEARWCIARILAQGQVRPTPRHWMRAGVRLTPGLRFVYWAGQADVCLLVLDGAVITIITHELCRRRRLVLIPGGIAEPIYAGAGSLERTSVGAIESSFEEAA